METRDAQVRQQDLCLDGQWKRHPEALKGAAKAIGGAIDLVTADVAKIEVLDRLLAEVREHHGRIDIPLRKCRDLNDWNLLVPAETNAGSVSFSGSN